MLDLFMLYVVNTGVLHIYGFCEGCHSWYGAQVC